MNLPTVRLKRPDSGLALLLATLTLASPLLVTARVARAEEATAAADQGTPEVFKGCIKYLGGPGFPDFKGKESWDNSLVIRGTIATSDFSDKTLAPISFDLADVTSILYGQASSRHAGVWVSVGVIIAPIALIGLLHKSRKHNVLLSWKSPEGKEGGVFLEVQPDHFRRLLNTLAYKTGKPVLADEKDRKWLMTQGVQAQLDPASAGDASSK